MILLEETKGGAKGETSAEDEMKLLTKAAKQRKDSADIYEQQGRMDLHEVEMAELSVIQEFLPKALSPEEIQAAIQAIISKAEPSTRACLVDFFTVRVSIANPA